MSDPITHSSVLPIASGGLSFLLARFFDIPPDMLFVAFLGAWIGIALRDALPVFSDKYIAVFYFLKTLGIIIAGTIIAAWLIPEILKKFPDVAQKTIAGGTGFLLVYFYKHIIHVIVFCFELFEKVLTLKFFDKIDLDKKDKP